MIVTTATGYRGESICSGAEPGHFQLAPWKRLARSANYGQNVNGAPTHDIKTPPPVQDLGITELPPSASTGVKTSLVATT
jgi:hypothetical protein